MQLHLMVDRNLAGQPPAHVYDRPTQPGLHGRFPAFAVVLLLVVLTAAAVFVALR